MLRDVVNCAKGANETKLEQSMFTNALAVTQRMQMDC
jgi:hypothetical protein